MPARSLISFRRSSAFGVSSMQTMMRDDIGPASSDEFLKKRTVQLEVKRYPMVESWLAKRSQI
jgi:hypothetical protein